MPVTGGGMKQIEVLRLLPGPTQRLVAMDCDEPLYQELVVASALGLAEGEGQRGEAAHHWRGRLTPQGVDHLAALERRERGDG